MTRKYKLERLQKNILLGVSGVTLASTIFLGSGQQNNQKLLNIDTIITSSSETKTLNKAQKENLKYFNNKNILDDDDEESERNL